MEYFDASDEVQAAIAIYMDETGEIPTKIYVSPFLYQWLAGMQKEECLLKGREEQFRPNRIETHIGELELVIDESLTDYDIVPE